MAALSAPFGLGASGDTPQSFKFDRWEVSVGKAEAVYPFFLQNVHALRVSGHDYNILYLSKPYIPVTRAGAEKLARSMNAGAASMKAFPLDDGGSIFRFETKNGTYWVSTRGGFLVATVDSTRPDARDLAESHVLGVDRQ